jgi:hypothetical protein
VEYCWSLTEFVYSPLTEEKIVEEFRNEYKGLFGNIKLRLCRVCVGTSTGHVFCCKPEKELRDHIRKIATAAGH